MIEYIFVSMYITSENFTFLGFPEINKKFFSTIFLIFIENENFDKQLSKA